MFNIIDLTDCRDTYLEPLSGGLFYCQIFLTP